MGKSVKNKQRQMEANEAAFQQAFVSHSKAARAPQPTRPLGEEMEAYRASMVRNPEHFILKTRSGHRHKQLLELARFVFGPYRVPKILDQVWSVYALEEPRATRNVTPRFQNTTLRNPNTNRIDFRAWYVCVATGGSLYKEFTKFFLTKKETHLFLNCSQDLDLSQALVYAVALAAGASLGTATRLARSKLALEDLTQDFWLDAIRFFARPDHCPASTSAASDLVDFVSAQRNENRNFRLVGSGFSLAALLRRKEEWHRALARAQVLGNTQWEGAPLPNHQERTKDINGNEVVWDFKQILNSKDLGAEGTAMRHCVLSYRHDCVSGRCSIWSLAVLDHYGERQRKITIELNNNGTIVQKRGLANRAPRSEENHVINRWASAMGLSSGYSY